MEHYILAINPGSTSTKVAVYKDDTEIFIKTIRHSPEELSQFSKITDQYQYRKDIINKELKDANIDIEKITGVIGRGGLVKPISSGIYAVNALMKEDLVNCKMGEHASNLGALIADDFASSLPNAKSYIADPVVVDELEPLARYSGHPLFQRVSIFHALNQKAIARTHAKNMGRNYEDMNLIVAHLGGGISVGAHCKGRVIDVNQCLDGDGPFSPERSGTLPIGAVVKAAFSGKYTLDEMKQMIKGKGGMCAYTGENDAYKVELAALDGDKKSYEVLDAMAYQIAKEIGAMYTVLCGNVDAILITGGMANSKWYCDFIIKRVHKLAPVYIYPGEDEMRALATNALDALTGRVQVKEYK